MALVAAHARAQESTVTRRVAGEQMQLPAQAPAGCEPSASPAGGSQVAQLITIAECFSARGEPVLGLATLKLAEEYAQQSSDVVARSLASSLVTATRASLATRTRLSPQSVEALRAGGEKAIFIPLAGRTALSAVPTVSGISLPVYFVTNRTRERDVQGRPTFSHGVGGDVFGVQTVALPTRAQSLAEVLVDARATKFRHETTELGPGHLLGSRAEFERQLCTVWPPRTERNLFLFVHGYANDFEDAVVSAASLGAKLEYSARTAIYSWPSDGDLVRYFKDEEAVESSMTSFTLFMQRLKKSCQGVRIHVLAHSMGNRLLIAGLERLADDGVTRADGLDEVVSAAADVDREYYAERAPTFASVARRFTMYASSHDWPLLLSHIVHWEARAGRCGKTDLLVAAAVESVDASAAGHAHWYYLESDLAVRDERFVLRGVATKKPPRPLQQVLRGGNVCWRLDDPDREIRADSAVGQRWLPRSLR